MKQIPQILVATLLLCSIAMPTLAEDPGSLPSPLREVGFEQRLGESISLDLPFVDSEGKSVLLADYFVADRPVVLALVYYECPVLCSMVLNGLVSSLDVLSFQPGQDYEVIVVSFDPGEGPELSRIKRTNTLDQLGREGAEDGVHFLTGDPASIDALTTAIGFSYVYDAEKDQYAHASGVTVLTPEGRISRYLFGVEYAPKDMRLALVESADLKIGSAVDQLLLFCYLYDPATGKYGAATMNLVRLGGGITVLGVIGFIALSRRRDRRLAAHPNQGSNPS
ncbi:SCO family protein [bacterium]|nr:MAG: SCO family protein [bacterium]